MMGREGGREGGQQGGREGGATCLGCRVGREQSLQFCRGFEKPGLR